ncbi:MAG TPA: CpsB/CapC family capsule biosynthesis tyrosine phosphatase [Conexibacter sp.]|nr:CpsB/CapC family capsule biosynthesis tyrosine phosphatase [Conexibacter sp.]
MSYVDLHCHLLPGLDDGAATADDMLRHARRLHAEGVRDVVCTPHIKRDEFPGVPIRELADRMAAAQRTIRAAGLAVRLHLGAELAHADALLLPDADLARISQGPEGSRWLLLECPFEGIDDDFALAFRRLQGLGYGLLLAHPERSDGLLKGDGLGRLRPLLAQGALLQVNVCSLLGNHGLDAQDAAVRLVREGLAYCLASDGHPGSREQTLQLGFHLLLRAGASSTQAYRLTQANPRLLLRDGVRRPLVDLERALAAAA